jgi:hypothetical protein
MVCKLCLKEKELCASHIIPEFFYKLLYDDNRHLFVRLSDDPEFYRHYKKGLRERLLCEECERKLNQWETHASRVLFGQIRLQVRDYQDAIVFGGADYNHFKLFQLSLLWRTGISQREEFATISLGTHEETLRKMIYDEAPGKPHQYGCMLIMTPSYFDIMSQLMMFGVEARFDGHKCYRFLFAGIGWVFIVSKHSHTIPFKERIFLSQNGDLPILKENMASKKNLEDCIKIWKQSGNLDRALRKLDQKL